MIYLPNKQPSHLFHLCSNKVVVFTLWNENADNFEEEEYASMQQPVIMAVSSCYLKTYGGKYFILPYIQLVAFLDIPPTWFLFFAV